MPQHHRTCSLCEAMCGLVITTEGDEVTEIRGDPDDVFSGGHICPKALGLADLQADPDRLREPIRRTSSGWETMGWNEALDLAAEKLRAVQKAHGRDAVAVYLGNPNAHSYGNLLAMRPFLRSLGTRSRFSATSLDQLPHMLAAYLMLGHQLKLPIPDLDRTELLVVFGANPAVSNGSLMTAGDVKARLRGIRERGGRLVVVDPARTRTAELADMHLAIRPGGDAALLAAVAREVLERGPRLRHLDGHLDGLDTLSKVLAPFTPEAVAARTGLDADVPRQLAADLLAAERPCVYGRMGVCTQEFGGLASWLLVVVNVLIGALDHEGGAMFPDPAIDFASLAGRGRFATRHTRVRGLPAFSGEYPAAALAEEMDTPGEGQLRGLVTIAGNPVLSSPNGRRLDRALEGLDCMVSVDFYLNETTRHADVILPPTAPLEHDHYDLAFHALAVRNTAKYSPAVFERGKDQRHDWEILFGLAARLRWGDGPAKLLHRVPSTLKLAVPHMALDGLLRMGPGRKALTLKQLKQAPHGVDLGPLEPCLPETLETEDTRIHLAPEPYLEDLPRLVEALGEGPSASLELIGRRELRTNNSWLHNSARLVKGKRRCTLRMHPDDAGGFSDGQRVRLVSDTGAIEVDLEVTDAIRPGVVSLPHGWGHDRQGIRLSVAASRPGASVNDVTDDARIDPLTGNAAFSAVPVRVEAV